MSDASDLIQYTAHLCNHIQQGEQLLRAAQNLLAKTQNEETCNERPPPELWEECRNIIEQCNKAIQGCKSRSASLRKLVGGA